MKQVTKQLQRDTQWLRVVHIGYGGELWLLLAKTRGFLIVVSLLAAEGLYVEIPPRLTVEEVIEVLSDISTEVRRLTRYKDMSRSNKSQILFKCEPFILSQDCDQPPALVRTTRFNGILHVQIPGSEEAEILHGCGN
jgi:hypothetical protein